MEPRSSYLADMIGENPEARLAIREIPHFRQSSDALLDLVYRYGRIFSLPHQGELTRESEFDQWVFFVISGRLVVTLGGEVVDTISSSLVGERCLLGEPRRATLRAAEEGIVALGVDMALLDTLEPGNGEDSHESEVLVELLSIIAGEIVGRVAQLSLNQIEISQKFASIQEADSLAALISRLAAHEFMAEPRANIEIYKFLSKTDKSLLAGCLAPGNGGGQGRVDTRKLFSACINSGRYNLISSLAEALYAALPEARTAPHQPLDPFEGCNFRDFSDQARSKVNAEFCEGSSAKLRRAISGTEWHQQLRADSELAVDVVGFCQWLRSTRGFSDLEIKGVLTTLLREASQYTATINGSIKAQVNEMSATALLAKLERSEPKPEGYMLEYINTGTPEELISLFGKHILEVHLVKPYLAALPPVAKPPPGSDELAGPPPPEGGGQNVADGLFD